MLQPVVARGGTGVADTIGCVWVSCDGVTPKSASSAGSQSDVFWEKSNHLQSAATRLPIVYPDYLHMNHSIGCYPLSTTGSSLLRLLAAHVLWMLSAKGFKRSLVRSSLRGCT